MRAGVALGPLSARVNCAGVLSEARVDDVPAGQAGAMWAVNVLGSARMTSAVAPHLGPGSAVVHIGGLTRVGACELASRGIRVNTIAPGFITVPMAPAWEHMSGGEAARRADGHMALASRNGAAHAVRLEPGTMLHRLLSPKVIVNSLHHQAVDEAAPGVGRGRAGAGRRDRGNRGSGNPVYGRLAVASGDDL